MSDPRNAVIGQLQGLGWTREQSIGIAANLHQESTFNPSAVGDGGKAYGIAQWHPDRQAGFKAMTGKDIQGSTLEEQVAFVDHELRKGNERAAGARLLGAKTAAEAASAVSEYYERPADRAGESSRRGQKAAMWAGEDIPAVAPPSASPARAVAGSGSGWFSLPGATPTPPKTAAPAASGGLLGALEAQLSGPANDPAAGRDQTDALRAEAEHEASLRTGFVDVFQGQRRDPRSQAMFTLLDKINGGEREVPPAGWSYAGIQDQVESGLNDDERAYLRENVSGPQSLATAQGQLAYRRELDQQVYGRAGGAANFWGAMAGGLMDPVGFAAGFGVSKAFQMTAIGSGALIAAGRPAAAVASSLAEASAGNVAVEWLQDGLGEVKGTSDYAMAAAFGAVLQAPFTRGVHSAAAARGVELEAARVQKEAALRQFEGMLKLSEETGIRDPAALAAEFERREKAELDAAQTDAATRGPETDQAVPHDVQDQIRREHSGEPDPNVEADIEAAKVEKEQRIEAEKEKVETAVKQADEREAAATKVEGGEAPVRDKLPDDLGKAAPRYSHGEKKYTLEFASDIDRASYIVSGKGKSKAHDRYLQFLAENGVSPAEAEAWGKQLRSVIKEHAAARNGGKLSIGDGQLHERLRRMEEQRAKVEKAEPAPVAEAKEPPPPEFDFPTLDTSMLDAKPTEGGVKLGTEEKPVRVKWELRKDKAPTTRGYSVSDVLDAILDDDGMWPPHVKALANYLQQKVSAEVGDVRMHFTEKLEGAGVFDPNSQHIEIQSKMNPSANLSEHFGQMVSTQKEVLVHEILHAATHSKIEAFLTGKLKGEAREAVQELADLQKLFRQWLHENHPQTRGLTANQIHAKASAREPGFNQTIFNYAYALQDLHEFVTMAMSNFEVITQMRRTPGKPVAGRPTSMWNNFVGAIKRIFTKDVVPGADDLWTNVAASVDRVISAPGAGLQYRSGEQMLWSPSLVANRNRIANAQRVAQHAVDWLVRNPINEAKLFTLNAFTKKWGGLSDGLVLAQSQNPILRMVSGLVTEVTTGAAGRRQTAAIRKEMIHRRIMGNAMLDYESNFDLWNKQNGGTLMDSVLHGEQKRTFNREVHEEILRRRNPNYQSAGGEIGKAADSLEGMFERARKEQIGAGTLGSDGLPATARGYVPQALDGAKLQNLSVQELADLHDALSTQFQARLGWDKQFSDLFAPQYTERIRRRSQGSKDVDALSGGGSDMQVIRDTLDAMALDPATRDKLAAGAAKSGLKQTKARLDLDLMAPVGQGGKKLLDLYVSDPMTLGRMYANRTAGDIALTETGILGIKGIRELRDAAGTHTGHPMPSAQEFEAFDRVMSEMMGTPVAGQVVSAGATNLRLLVGLQRLGGLVFAQAAEAWNMIHHVGLRSTLAGNLQLGKYMGEVGRLKKGQASGNSILTTMETYGGEFGMEHYKMVAPLDPPDQQVEQYLKQSGLIGRLLRGGVHLQSKVSFFRGLLSAQHRMVAEQITLKAMRYVREGGNDAFLADMGFTPDLVTRLRNELPQIASFDSTGRLTRLDLTQVSDARIAEALTGAVHRGTSQIIQGTFIGERSAWMHNDYLKLLLQLRTFGLTATEKQLGRVAAVSGGGVRGYGYAGGLMLGQMALALPMHMARVQLAAAGREDREEYIRQQMNPATIVRTLMNYSSMSGSAGDVLDLTTALAGGWLDQDGKEVIGARTGGAGTIVSKAVPALGSIEGILKAAGGSSDLHKSIKQAPFSNLWFLQPAINITHDE